MVNIRLKVWVNAFIPKDLDGITEKVSAGVHSGKTMIRGPIFGVSDCFLTDQRSFDEDPNASSRMHSIVEIECVQPHLIDQNHRSDRTIEIDCEDGDEECNSFASVSRLRIEGFSSSIIEDETQINFRFVGEASNSCFSGAPDIDWNIGITVSYHTNERVNIEVDGKIDAFPAFEMYAQINDGSVISLFQKLPDAGSSPSDLFGGPKRHVKVQNEILL